MFNRTQIFKFSACGLAIATMATLGCASCNGILGVDRCADIPAGAIPQPAGTKLCDWQTVQVSGAITDQTVLYQADFIGTSANLSPGALKRMARNANNGLLATQPTLIEPSGDADLDASRVDTANLQLVSFGITSPMVEVATPAALGLRGPEAEQAAGEIGEIRRASTGFGTPFSQPSGFGGSGRFGGYMPGGIF